MLESKRWRLIEKKVGAVKAEGARLVEQMERGGIQLEGGIGKLVE